MTPSPELFELIKSLTKSEKRYVRLNFSIHKGDKNYLKLFDVIEKQEEYDEEKIKVLFNKELFIKRLPVAKAYLYSTLLKVLRQYHASGTAEVKISEMLHEVEILINKGLFQQAHKIVLRAKKLAQQYDKTLQLIDIGRWESRLLGLVIFISKKKLSFSDVIKEEATNVEKLKKNLLFRSMSWDISNTIVNTGITNSKELKDELKKIDTSLLKSPPANVDFDTNVYYYHAMANYYRAMGDHRRFYDSMRSLLNLYENNPEQIEEYPYNLLAILNNFIHSVNLLKKYDEALVHLKRIKNISFSSRLKYLLVYETVLRIESTIYAQQERYSEVIKLINDNKKELVELEADKIQLNLFRIYFNASWSYFNLYKYNQAVGFINKILNDKLVKNNIDFRLQAEVLNLVIHFEMNNVDLLESLIKSQHFLIKKKYKHNQFHFFILEMFSELIKQENKDQQPLIREYLSKLKKMYSDDQEMSNSLIQCEFLIKWMEKNVPEANCAGQ